MKRFTLLWDSFLVSNGLSRCTSPAMADGAGCAYGSCRYGKIKKIELYMEEAFLGKRRVSSVVRRHEGMSV